MTTTARRAAATLLLLTLALLTGCGDDSSAPDARDTRSPSGPTVEATAGPTATPASYDGSDPAGLLTCLTDAGLSAEANDSVPFGVEVPVAGLTVTDPAGGEQGADLWVFSDRAAAEDNRDLITLSDDDTPTNRLVANVVVHFYALPDEGDPLVAATTGCLV